MNKICLIGRLTRDIENRTTESGKVCGTFTLAVNRKFKNANGNYDADFINCVVWNNAETLAKYTKKGDMLAVEGRLQNRSYESDGIKKYITEVIVESFDFIATKKETKENTTQNDPYKEFSQELELTADELPF